MSNKSEEELKRKLCKIVGWSYSKDGWAFERHGEQLNCTEKLDALVDEVKAIELRAKINELKHLWSDYIIYWSKNGTSSEWEDSVTILNRIAQLRADLKSIEGGNE